MLISMKAKVFLVVALLCLFDVVTSDYDTLEEEGSLSANPSIAPSYPQLNFPYERSYTVVVEWGAEECFYIEEIFPGNKISFSFLVRTITKTAVAAAATTTVVIKLHHNDYTTVYIL